VGKKIAIVQSNYIPWKGYFDLINMVDEFIFYDTVQFTKNDWRNQNKIKTPQALQWLTVPVRVRGKYHQIIHETEIDSMDWAKSHWKSLCQNYRRANHFNAIAQEFEPLNPQTEYSHLSQLSRTLIEWVYLKLHIKTIISNSWDYQLIDVKTERLTDLYAQAGGCEYISGPEAKDYIDECDFSGWGVKLTTMSWPDTKKDSEGHYLKEEQKSYRLNFGAKLRL